MWRSGTKRKCVTFRLIRVSDRLDWVMCRQISKKVTCRGPWSFYSFWADVTGNLILVIFICNSKKKAHTADPFPRDECGIDEAHVDGVSTYKKFRFRFHRHLANISQTLYFAGPTEEDIFNWQSIITIMLYKFLIKACLSKQRV